MELNEDQIAEAAHELNRLYCKFIGDEPQPSWADAPDWQRRSTIQGVRMLSKKGQQNQIHPAEIHNFWMKKKLEDGWSYAEKIDAEKKKHPCIMPFEFLSREQQLKDVLFVTTVYTLLAPTRDAQQARDAAKIIGGRA